MSHAVQATMTQVQTYGCGTQTVTSSLYTTGHGLCILSGEAVQRNLVEGNGNILLMSSNVS